MVLINPLPTVFIPTFCDPFVTVVVSKNPYPNRKMNDDFILAHFFCTTRVNKVNKERPWHGSY